MTAAGRGEYVPLMSNDTNEGRAANRRTRIVILPQLDQFFNLLETKEGLIPIHTKSFLGPPVWGDLFYWHWELDGFISKARWAY